MINTRQTSVGLKVGVFVGDGLGTLLGDNVGILVGLGVVGAGVEVVGMSDGAVVGPWVGTQDSRGSIRRLISVNKLGL